MYIAIPSDVDGFIPLQCPLCKGYFKLTHDDIKSDDCFKITCPCCGIVSQNYYTSDIIQLLEIKSKNLIIDELNGLVSHLHKLGNMHLKANKSSLKKEHESSIKNRFDELLIYSLDCCKKNVKITPIANVIGVYCPFCGVFDDAN